jgi:hypothetical protein
LIQLAVIEEPVTVQVTVTPGAPSLAGFGVGALTVTTGLATPALTVTDPLAMPVAPRLSVTVNVTGKIVVPDATVYLWKIVFTATDVVLPSPKFQVYLVIVVPTWPGALAAALNVTVHGEVHVVEAGVKLAVGGISAKRFSCCEWLG